MTGSGPPLRNPGLAHLDSQGRDRLVRTSWRLVPVKLDGRGSPLRGRRRITKRMVVRTVFAALGLAVFRFGRIDGATGSALPLMQYHVLAQIPRW